MSVFDEKKNRKKPVEDAVVLFKTKHNKYDLACIQTKK